MAIKNILCPIDFSAYSSSLKEEVEWLANHCDATVTLMHVFEIPVTWSGTGEAPLMSAECFEQCASDARKRLANYALQVPANRVNRVLAQGDAAWQIKNWVEQHETDLVVIGSHGYGTLRRLLLGSVALKVLHDLSCPVWTHSHRAREQQASWKGVSKIICALELTEEAIPLLRFTKRIANETGASVRLLHSVPEIQPRPYQYFDTDLHKFLKESAAKSIEQSQSEAGTDFPFTIGDGSIAGDTAALVANQQADLVVIGRGKSQDIFGTLRTHAYDIIRQAGCPVLSYCADQAEGKSPISRKFVRQEVALSVG